MYHKWKCTQKGHCTGAQEIYFAGDLEIFYGKTRKISVFIKVVYRREKFQNIESEFEKTMHGTDSLQCPSRKKAPTDAKQDMHGMPVDVSAVR